MILRVPKEFSPVNQLTFDWFVGRIVGLTVEQFANGTAYYNAEKVMVAIKTGTHSTDSQNGQTLNRFYIKP